ncbi:MAG: DUF177 domain-containing protein [Acidimicrobiaceae bacterium]|nr:DUF177 domain-containing protein [Acidimicrobiaceae bacterium]
MASPYVVPVAHLLRTTPASAHVAFEAPFDPNGEFEPRGPVETDVDPLEPVRVDLTLQSFSGGVHARGSIETTWHGVCRRCSVVVRGALVLQVVERFVESPGPEDEEAYSLEHDALDLAPLVHDSILLELPLAPLCRPDCRGLCPVCGQDRNEVECDCAAPLDPRWATLDGLLGDDSVSTPEGDD